jgi:hypothetical protein
MQPPFLRGDPFLRSMPFICAIESPRLTLAVILRQREILLFDHFKQDEKRVVRHWRHELTDELWEPRRIPIVASCFVLDTYLLFASADGVIRAKPRNNPNSTYHVKDIKLLVVHMVSLYNVLAIIYSHNVLEVWQIIRISDDPYLHFQSVWKYTGVDSRNPPLLYGPYVVYQSFDGTWYKQRYDPVEKKGELVKVPFHAGWTIVRIKNVNWRYWSFVLKNPKTNKEEEFQIGLKGGIASCIEYGEQARFLCGGCEDVGYCDDHKNEQGH